MRWRCKKKKRHFFLLSLSVSHSLPPPLVPPPTLLFLAMTQRLDPSHFLSLQKQPYTSEREGVGVGGVGEAETVRETEGRGEDARGRLWHKRHFIAQTRFQRINTNIPVTLCWYCRRMYGVAQSHSSSGVQVSVGAELTKPWLLHSCRHLQSELNPSYDVK